MYTSCNFEWERNINCNKKVILRFSSSKKKTTHLNKDRIFSLLAPVFSKTGNILYHANKKLFIVLKNVNINNKMMRVTRQIPRARRPRDPGPPTKLLNDNFVY